jgi:hypothetical protein
MSHLAHDSFYYTFVFFTKGVRILSYLPISINWQYISFDYTHVHFD